MFDSWTIHSPKRASHAQDGWEGFFPYYAGFPDAFARDLLASAKLKPNSLVHDPWNGSGTTTFVSTELGHRSIGFDINPAMVVVARARLLPSSEADSLVPLAESIVADAHKHRISPLPNDPLLIWFDKPSAALIRSIERQIRKHLVGSHTETVDGIKLQNISSFAATFYVALFGICRHRAARFRATNPTWLREPKQDENRISATWSPLSKAFVSSINKMANSLAELTAAPTHALSEIKVADSTAAHVPDGSVDFILTSPPYCTRIDYGAATRIELAVLASLVKQSTDDLRRGMIGSVRVPAHEIKLSENWGDECGRFLQALKQHPSKASDGYYYRTHADYFDKMARSMVQLRRSLKAGGRAVLVAQDSYYKEIHNDVPRILAEMAESAGLKLRRRDDFVLSRSMSGINRHSKRYADRKKPVEAVLCFEAVGEKHKWQARPRR